MMENKKNKLDLLNKKGSGFAVPGSYFSGFDKNFLKKRKRRSTGFATPNAYFKKIEKSVFEKLSMPLKSEPGFSTPKDYFINVTEEIAKKVRSNGRSKIINLFNNKRLGIISVSIAASFLLYFGISELSVKEDNSLFEGLNVEEIELWIDEDLVSLNSYEIAEAFDGIELTFEDTYSDDDIIDYLEDGNVENLIIEN